MGISDRLRGDGARGLLVALVALPPIFVFGDICLSTDTAKSLALLAALVLAFVVAAVWGPAAAPTKAGLDPARARFLLLVAAFTLARLLPLLVAGPTYQSRYASALLVGDLALVLLLVIIPRPPEGTGSLPLMFAAIAALLSVWGLLEFAGLLPSARADFTAGGRISGPSVNADYLAGILLLSLFLALGGLKPPLKGGRPLRLAGLLLVIAATILTLGLTRSKAALAGLAAGAIVLGFLALQRGRGRRRLILALAAAAIIVLALLLLAFGGTFGPRLAAGLAAEFRIDSPSFEGLFGTRLPLWQTGLRLWTASPATILFGGGPGAFASGIWTALPADYRLHLETRSYLHAHDEPLNLLVEGGLLSLLLWAALIVFALGGALRSARAEGGSRAATWSSATVAAALVAGLVHQLASPILSTAGARVLFILCLVLVLALDARPRPEPAAAQRRRLLPLLGLLLALLALAFALPRFLSEREALAAVMAGFRGDAPGATAHFAAARGAEPGNPGILHEELIRGLGRDPARDLALEKMIAERAPGFRNVEKLEAMTLAGNGDYAGAARLLGAWMGRDRFDAEAGALLAALRARAGDRAGARQALEDLIIGMVPWYEGRNEAYALAPGRVAVVTTTGGETAAYRFEAGLLEAIVDRAGAAANPGAAPGLIMGGLAQAYRAAGYGEVWLDWAREAARRGALTRGEFEDYLRTVEGSFDEALAELSAAKDGGPSWRPASARAGRLLVLLQEASPAAVGEEAAGRLKRALR